MSDQAVERKIEATYAQKMAFKRALLEAMRNMAMISAYVFAAAYLSHRHASNTYDKVVVFFACAALGMISAIAASFAMDLFWAAVHDRFPNFRDRKVLRLLGAIAVTVVAMAPTYLTYFKGE